MRKIISMLTICTTLDFTSNAYAATATANFNAHVKIAAACSATATALDFGTLPGMIQGTETATSTLTVTCSTGTPYTLSLQAGSGAMAGQTRPTEKVNYNAILVPTSSTGTGSAQAFTINGSLPAQTTPSAQDYQEARTVNISY
jgi:spore coat protein U-like protein